MFLSDWREFLSAPCLAGKKTWRQLTSRRCWNRARPWHASELVSFLVGLRTYQHPTYDWRSLRRHRAETWTVFYCLNRAAGHQDAGVKETSGTEGWKYSRNDSLWSFCILFHHLDINTWLLISLSIQHPIVLSVVKWLDIVCTQRPFLPLNTGGLLLTNELGSRGSSCVTLFTSTTLPLSMANMLKSISSQKVYAMFIAFPLLSYCLTFWRRNYFFNFSTPCI